ncbi:MAG: DUF1800 family protein [Ilumatobacter sp.]
MTATALLPPAQTAARSAPMLSRTEATRFLQRATFGPTPDDVDQLMGEGIEAWLDRELTTTPNSSIYDLVVRSDKFDQSVWTHYLSGNAPLRKRVGYALSQIFVVSVPGINKVPAAAFADLLEAHAFGNYRDLLGAVTKSPAMGQYLTYMGNRKANPAKGTMPDENYAREILQLFSIGLERTWRNGWPVRDSNGDPLPAYGEADVQGLARVFTGWRLDMQAPKPQRYRNEMWHDHRRYENGEKTFLGLTIPAGVPGPQALDMALDHIAGRREVGGFISRQLIQRLVTSNPSGPYVKRVIDAWENDGTGVRGNLGAVVKAILTDPEATGAATRRSGKLREPVLRFSAVLKALDVSSTQAVFNIRGLQDSATKLGQTPFRSPSVFNFYRPGYVPPQTALAEQGMVAPEFQIANEASVIGWTNFLSKFIAFSPNGIKLDRSGLLPLADDPEALVDEVAARLLGREMSAETRAIVVDCVGRVSLFRQWTQRIERVNTALVLTAASPDFLHEA